MARENANVIYIKKAEIKKIQQLRKELQKEEAEYQQIMDSCQSVSSMSKDFDELIKQSNLCSVRIDATKQKILNLMRTGSKYGHSLEKDYIIYLQNRFDI